MRIAIIGTGYVGLVTGTCFSEMGNNVICVDSNRKKIKKLKSGITPIFEPGLSDMIRNNAAKGNLNFTTNTKSAVEKSDLILIAVGTPQGEDGSADLQYVLEVAKDIGKYLGHPAIIIDKSTVPVGTADKVRKVIAGELKKRKRKIRFDVVSNPEFLKEGAAISDFMKPDRVVVGVEKKESIEIMKELYAPFTRNYERLVIMDIRSAEVTKYAANAMLATRISFMNELARLCEKVGADINMVRQGMGSDQRIGHHFLYAGCGYGGSCFPKDIQALIRTGNDHGEEMHIITATEEANQRQKKILVEKIVKRFGENLKGKKFALWGLSFKPETDDMRYAPSIVITEELIKRGARVCTYDPKAHEEAKNCYLKNIRGVVYCQNKEATLAKADALIIATEWKEFRSPNFSSMKKRMKRPIIFDGRNIYDCIRMKEYDFEYYPIGVGRKSCNIKHVT